ncbi:MAG: ParB/RepB/Spo0J family partition protein [Reyranella sp.]|uniref:ParB/RepB/Spo0J family partition protein n=1 Tax=Reyranella sp. TaxID=1929291 RepID=UPI003D106F30
MSQPPKARGLGRGLSALLGDDDVATAVAPVPAQPTNEAPAAAHASAFVSSRPPTTLPVGQLRPGKMQPRTSFDGIEVLVDSIKEFGLLQPILVRPAGGQPDSYEIVAGERRWRAAQKAQLHEVPVVVRTMGDLDALQLGLIENLQRTDLSAIDEARGYRRLMMDFTQTQEDVAKVVGKSRPHVANTLRLLELPVPVQEMVQRGELSAGQARTLIGVPDALALAKRAAEEKLSVRELERLRSEAAAPAPAAGGRAGKAAAAAGPKSADTRALERRIEEALGLKADLRLRGLGEQSVLTLEIRDFDQLDSVVDKLTRR